MVLIGTNEIERMMKKVFLILLMALCCVFNSAAAEKKQISMSYEELKKQIESSPFINLFDVRKKEEYDAGHIPSASNFPLDQLETKLQEILDNGYSYMTTQIIVYGSDEMEAIEAASIMRYYGFSNVWCMRSVEDWDEPLVTTEEETRLLGNLHTQDIQGNSVDFSLLKDYKITMVNVWATYCGPCLDELADLGRLAEDMKPQGVQIVGVLSDVISASFEPEASVMEAAKKIVEQTKADYPHLIPSADMYRKVISAITVVPTTFFVDELGNQIGRVYVGSRSYEDWKAILQEMIAQ